MASEWFRTKLMESYRTGKQQPLMDALTNMMAEGILTLCARCQSDRLVCALRPLCGDRKYTSLLADMGADEDEIKKTHAFCFSNHLSRLKDIKERKEPFDSVKDAKFPLSTFVRIVSGNSQKELFETPTALSQADRKKTAESLESLLAKGWGNLTSVTDGDRFILYGNKNGVIQIDLEGSVATLNPFMEPIRDELHFRAVLNLLSILQSVETKVQQQGVAPFRLTYTFQVPAGQQRNLVKDEFSKLVNKMRDAGIPSTLSQPTKENRIQLHIEVPQPASGRCYYEVTFTYADLKNITRLLSKSNVMKHSK